MGIIEIMADKLKAGCRVYGNPLEHFLNGEKVIHIDENEITTKEEMEMLKKISQHKP